MKTCRLKGCGINIGVKNSYVIGDLCWHCCLEEDKADRFIFIPGAEYFDYEPWTEYGYIVTINGHGYCPDKTRIYFDSYWFHMLFDDVDKVFEMAFDELTQEIFKE